ncbi:anaphase-promoting complex, cyclosome, subunit 4-domain-containing protein [Xylariomycetidae sp. FL2044]|nr:anaphase-promoting complex, cyclosome, subunit 4-domain-containing protein [Xylariomycetidae sp. FL2044]
MTEPIELRLFSETRLEPRPRPGLLTCNPSIELLAGAAGPKTLQIWRFNGEVVTTNIQRGERDTVDATRWKPDGQFLAVGWSDGVVRLMGLETNKAVHQMSVCEAGKFRITCIGWARNYAGRNPHPSSIKSSFMTWENLASQVLDTGSKNEVLDLPRELAFLEVETALPKLGPLPISGGFGDDSYVFTTIPSLEFLFRPLSPQDSDKVDVMIVGTNDGRIHISMYDSFVIGSFDSPFSQTKEGQSPLQLYRHASHPDLSTHSLIFKSSETEKTKTLYLIPLDLTFIQSSPENLSLLASKTTTLQKLLRYVNQVQMHMVHEWQATRELPSRFVNSINETLRESGNYGDIGIGQAMYHSVVTGHTFPEVKEWLVDQLAERGHKRWDKAVVSGLKALRGLAHENFIPALERVGIILSRLLGISRFHEGKAEIGFTSAQIMVVMDIVSCSLLVANKILLLVMEELELFECFSTWLRHEIDRLASSSSTDELTEKEATMQHGKVLAYIQQYLPASPLRYYLSKVPDAERDGHKSDEVTALTDLLNKQIKKHEESQTEIAVLPQIEYLCSLLSAKSSIIFDGLAEAEKRSVRFGQPTEIRLERNISKIDVRVSSTAQPPDASQGLTFTAITTEEEENEIYVFRTTTNITNGISGSVTTELSRMTLGDGKILDLSFLYDDSLLVLWALKDEPIRLIRIPHQSNDLGYKPYVPSGTTTASAATAPPHHILTNDQVTSVFLNMTLPSDPSSSSSSAFVPTQMEVREASFERGKLPPRICLLGGRDLSTCRVYALPEDPFGQAASARKGKGKGKDRMSEGGGDVVML